MGQLAVMIPRSECALTGLPAEITGCSLCYCCVHMGISVKTTGDAEPQRVDFSTRVKVLVLGSGSIGRRHTRNLHDLGIPRVAVVDPEPERLQPMVAEFGVSAFSQIDKALSDFQPDLALVCTPPSMHVEQALAVLQAGAHVFIEKPLASSLDRLSELKDCSEQNSRLVQVGYNLRFHPCILRLKEIVDTRILGRLLWARAEFGYYLPYWRPWQDFRQNYSSRRDLGGGILLDDTHEIDLITWLFGMPAEFKALEGSANPLKIDVEDCVTAAFRYQSGLLVDLHVDFLQQAYSRSFTIAGADGTAIFEYPSSRIVIRRHDQPDQVESFEVDANQMYIDEIRHFLNCAETGCQPRVSLQDGIDTLRIALAVREEASRPGVQLQ